eukprot:2402282-Pyramimonas_sp.AAC.1
MAGVSADDPFLQARFTMMRAASPWTQQMEDIVRCVGSQQAQPHTRRREGARSVGLYPWGFPFEMVGWGDLAGWRDLVRTLLTDWKLQHILAYVILPEPQPWRPKNCEEVEEEESEEKNDKIAKRLAFDFENASMWNYEARRSLSSSMGAP